MRSRSTFAAEDLLRRAAIGRGPPDDRRPAGEETLDQAMVGRRAALQRDPVADGREARAAVELGVVAEPAGEVARTSPSASRRGRSHDPRSRPGPAPGRRRRCSRRTRRDPVPAPVAGAPRRRSSVRPRSPTGRWSSSRSDTIRNPRLSYRSRAQCGRCRCRRRAPRRSLRRRGRSAGCPPAAPERAPAPELLAGRRSTRSSRSAAVLVGRIEEVEDLAGDLVPVEGDPPQRRVETADRRRTARRPSPSRRRRPSGPAKARDIGLEHAPVHRPIGRVDRADLEPVRQRQVRDVVEVGPDRARRGGGRRGTRRPRRSPGSAGRAHGRRRPRSPGGHAGASAASSSRRPSCQSSRARSTPRLRAAGIDVRDRLERPARPRCGRPSRCDHRRRSGRRARRARQSRARSQFVRWA